MRTLRLTRSLALSLSLIAVGVTSGPARGQGLQYFALTPCRAVDTRYGNGPIIAASVARAFTIKTVCGVPSTAKAVTVNLTIVIPTDGGFFTLWPYGGAFPNVSNINFDAGEPAIANGAIVPLASGTPDLYGAYGTASGAGYTHAVMDVTGYFQ